MNMMTLEEIIELKQKLERDSISTDKAKEYFFNNMEMNKKSWHTKDWKERRKQVIKDKCEQCGGSEILTLQNLSKPEKFNKYYLNAYMHFHSIFDSENTMNFEDLISKNDILNYIDATPREIFSMCPKCCGNYYSVKRIPHFVCSRCKYEFDEPMRKLLPEYIDDLYNNFDLSTIDKPANAPGNRKVRHIMLYSYIRKKLANNKFKENFKEKYQCKIDKKTMIDYLNANIEYLSLENTKTLCKKCSFSKKIIGKDLCPICNKNYKKLQYKTCVDCIPDEEQRNKIKESLAFYKEMREMHISLGIE
jgi:hypothetical protein